MNFLANLLKLEAFSERQSFAGINKKSLIPDCQYDFSMGGEKMEERNIENWEIREKIGETGYFCLERVKMGFLLTFFAMCAIMEI